eukprot:gene22384-27007_t
MAFLEDRICIGGSNGSILSVQISLFGSADVSAASAGISVLKDPIIQRLWTGLVQRPIPPIKYLYSCAWQGESFLFSIDEESNLRVWDPRKQQRVLFTTLCGRQGTEAPLRPIAFCVQSTADRNCDIAVAFSSDSWAYLGICRMSLQDGQENAAQVGPLEEVALGPGLVKAIQGGGEQFWVVIQHVNDAGITET